MNRLKFLTAALPLLLLAAAAPAQFIVLKDGQRLSPQDVQIANGKIMREKIIGAQKAQVTMNFSDIDHLEWDNPQQLVQARSLMAAGKAKEAIAVLAEARTYFKPFKDIPGNPYPEVVISQVEAMDAAGDFDDLVKEMPEITSMKWDDETSLKLRVIKLNMDRRTSSDSDGLLAEAKQLLKDTDNSSVCAKLWVTIGDTLTKKEKYEEALFAYLNVPVFYGSQASLVPQSELMAARSLVKMERFEDAAGMFQRISESYPGSDVAETANKERLVINGLKNKPDDFGKKKDAKKDSKDAK